MLLNVVLILPYWMCSYLIYRLHVESVNLFKQWLKLSSDDVTEQIVKLAKKGLTPSQIGNC